MTTPYRSWAEIDLAAVIHNLDRVRTTVGTDVDIMAVVKADAYGLGAPRIAAALADAGVTSFGVGDSGEALELAASGLRGRIHILGAVVDDEIDDCILAGITPTLHSMERLRLFEERSAALARTTRVHIKVDTGMGRLGAHPKTALKLLRAVHEASHLELDGVATHLAQATDPQSGFNRVQLERFNSLLQRAAELGLATGRRHAAASAAVFTEPAAHYDCVRPGLALHGLGEGAFHAADHGLRPVLSWRTQIVYLKGLVEGQTVGYGSRHRTRRPALIATLAVGYADGVPTAAADGGEVLVHGKHARIVGAISMDYTTIDVSHVPRVRVGDTVTIIGRDDVAEIRAESLARRSHLPVYALSCGLGRRVVRTYKTSAHSKVKA